MCIRDSIYISIKILIISICTISISTTPKKFVQTTILIYGSTDGFPCGGRDCGFLPPSLKTEVSPHPPLTEGFGRGRTPEVQAGTAPTVGRRDLANGAGHTAWVTLRKNLPSARVGRRGNARYRRGRAASGPRPSGHRLVSQRSPVHVRYE